MLPDSIAPYEGPLLALLLAFAGAALLRGRGGGRWVGVALPLAALAGFAVTMGGFSASPRQLPERLPLLAAGALALAVLLAAVPRTWLAVALALLAGAATGWWVAGAPLTEADLRRAAPVLLVTALLVPVLYRDSAGPWRAQVAVLALAAGLWAAGTPGPWFVLALGLLAATLPLALAGAAMPEPGRLALAVLLVALLAGPVLGRGAAQDWAAALAPLIVLLLGPRRPGAAGALALVATAAVPVALVFGLAR
ncbi:MAG: hypothetical protein MUF65_02685 [Rubritepida sp.]|jgi:hypothetical protein|nr:hypothetical protein [Rubritepida sp.]